MLMSSASASACSRDGDGDTELDLDVNILSRRRYPGGDPPLRGTGKEQGRRREAVGKASSDSSGRRRGATQPAEREPRGAGSAASEPLGRSSGALRAGRELHGEGGCAAGSQHHHHHCPSRAGSLNSGGLDWLGVAGEPLRPAASANHGWLRLQSLAQ